MCVIVALIPAININRNIHYYTNNMVAYPQLRHRTRKNESAHQLFAHENRAQFSSIEINKRMRKGTKLRQLGRDSEHRWAMLRNMVTSLIKHERIMTTTARAKELRRVAEKLVTHAKGGGLHHQRLAGEVVREKPALIKLFEILGPRYEDRPGGYTRILKLGKPRRGDSADMAYIEFVDREGELRKAKPVVVLGGIWDTIAKNQLTRNTTESEKTSA